ncbi:YLS9 protein [Spatholobus suberectus]|nr:YLS9 protein [Spatholobus suberectus]
MTQCPKVRIKRLLVMIIIVIVGTTILAIFFLWYLHNYSTVKLFVMNATLTQFNYTNNIFYYNLTLNIMVSSNIYYNYINASVWYQNVTFGSQTVKTLNESLSGLNMDFKGQHVMALNTNQILELNKEKKVGIYHVNVKLCPRLRYDTNKLKPMICCDLQVPLKSHKEIPQAHGFHATQCDSCYEHDDICSLKQNNFLLLS